MLTEEWRGVAQGSWLTEDTVRDKVWLTIAHLSIGCKVGHWRVSCCRPSSLSKGVRETDGWSIIAGHVRVRHWWIAVTLETEGQLLMFYTTIFLVQFFLLSCFLYF